MCSFGGDKWYPVLFVENANSKAEEEGLGYFEGVWCNFGCGCLKDGVVDSCHFYYCATSLKRRRRHRQLKVSGERREREFKA